MIRESSSIVDSKKKTFSLLVILCLVIISAGYFFYKYEEKYITQKKYIELKTITDLKQQQLEQWLNEKIAEVNSSAKSYFFGKAISSWIYNIRNDQLKNEILNRIKIIQQEFHYENILIFSNDSNLLMSSSSHPEELDLIVKQKLEETYKNRKITFTDLYYSSVNEKIHYDIVAPIFNDKKNIIALILFRSDPNQFLFPLIQTWPTPSPSAETAVLRREGDNVLFLNNLRHKKNTALNLKVSITETEVLSVQSALGKEGFVEGIDYRGVPAVGDIRKIPFNNWIMLSKVDKSEIYAELFVLAGLVSGFAVLMIVTCAVGLAFIYNSRQKVIYSELYKKEKEVWQNQEKFKVTMDSLGEGIIITDINAKIQYMNNLAEDLTNWKLREAKGRKLSEIYYVKNEETGLIENNILDKVIKHGLVKELANHTILISKAGKEIPVLDTGAPIFDSDGTILGIVIAFQDESEKRKNQKLLAESEARFRSTLDDMLEGCQILDHNWKYVYINDSAEIHTRRPKSELIGKIYMDIWPGIESTELFSRLKECMEQRVSEQMINEFKFPDGKIGWFRLNIDPVKEGLIILSEDITTRRLAEEKLKANENYLSTLFDSIADSIFTISMPGRIIQRANSAVYELFGYEPNEVIGETARKFYLNENSFLDYGEKLTKAINENIPFVKEELELFKKDGTKIYCDAQTTFLKKKGKVDTAISVLRDITLKKKAELELIAAKKKAEESDKLKSEFLAQISHEIRTPLNIIQGCTSFLKEEIIDNLAVIDSTKYEDIFIGINLSSKRIIRTVDLILNMAELQAGEFKPLIKEINLHEDILEKLINEHIVLVSSKSCKLNYDVKTKQCNINADEYSVSQIFANLIDNAIKYTQAGSIDVELLNDKSGNVVVEVKDTGIGMSEEFMEQMFKPFSQEEQGYSRSFEGNGLGLALVKRYCDLNNAELKVESTKGIGSTFTVIFKNT